MTNYRFMGVLPSTLSLLVLSLLILLPPMASAAILNVNSEGILTGAQNVLVGGDPYDVVFRDGKFGEIFVDPPDPVCSSGTCKTIADWDALTYGSSVGNPGSDAFAIALLEQVLIDGPAGSFDSNPGLVLGCIGTTTNACIVATPTEKNQFGQTATSTIIFNGRAVNYDTSGAGTDQTDRQNFTTNMDLATLAGGVWADWSPSVIPVPGAVWLFGSALGLIGWMRRWKN